MNLVICAMLTLVALSPVPEIAGKIVDYNGKVVSGVTISVVAIPSNQVMEKTVSAPDGSFQISGLAAGAYGVEAKTDAACAISSAIPVSAGFTSVVQLRLIKGLCQSALEFVKPPGKE
jgi:Carboxypeptidase regulatory-like domain